MQLNRETFKAIDTDYSGLISHEELVKTLDTLKRRSSSEKIVDQIMSSLDFDKNGNLNFSEFLSGTLDPAIHLTEFKMKQLFAYLDPFC